MNLVIKILRPRWEMSLDVDYLKRMVWVRRQGNLGRGTHPFGIIQIVGLSRIDRTQIGLRDMRQVRNMSVIRSLTGRFDTGGLNLIPSSRGVFIVLLEVFFRIYFILIRK